ncbi:MAG: alpha/beta fold hydrolase [Deltaproteobacteria bacterium]|nr:alpha/beta fold hydrolase [Deltaproteobacteria bacterium]
MSDLKIMKGAEPFFFQGSDIGVLISHGFTGNPQSMRYYGEKLHQAGYTVIGPLLKGHGTTTADMAGTTAKDWIQSLIEALEKLRKTCSHIFVTGLSMGGTLSLYMAAMYPDIIEGVIPINAAVQLETPALAALAFDSEAPATVPGIGSDIKDPDSKELAYEEVPVASIKEGYVLSSVTRDLLPIIKCPAFVITSRVDHVVSTSNGRIIPKLLMVDRIESLWLNNSYHVATLDHDKDLICDRVCAFINSIIG